jgi:hypothetical protein
MYLLHLQGRRISRARNQRESRWQAELLRNVGQLSTDFTALYPRRHALDEVPRSVIFSVLLLLPLSDLNILFSTQFSNTLNLRSSLRARNQISCSYKTAGKITALYILIFMFLSRRRGKID